MTVKNISLCCMVLISAFFSVGCKKLGGPLKKGDTTATTIPKDTTVKNNDTVNVYVAGNTLDTMNNVNQAVYWKNQVSTVLTHGTKAAAANAIAVQGNDVYAAGYTTDANGNIIASYWKNGTQVNLTDKSTVASAVSIALQGNDVYVAGYEGDKAVYWKNGQEVAMPKLVGVDAESCGGIAIQGADVYLSGQRVKSGSTVSAMYWKNGVPTILPTNGKSGYGGNIVVQNGNVYIPVATLSSSFNKTDVTYLKNGVPVSLGDGTFGLNATDIAVNGADVYVVCSTSKGAGYFKNSMLTILTGSSVQTSGLAVIGNNVYVSGQTNYQKKSVAAFWKNGVPVYLSTPIGKSGFASSVVLAP